MLKFFRHTHTINGHVAWMLLFFVGFGQAADNDLSQRLVQDAEQQQAQMVARHGLHPDQRWANKCQQMIAHLALKRFQSCLVLDADHANAYALAHGVVMLTHGLLTQINNDHQLAHVLAHEHAHLLLDHHLQAAEKIQNPPTFFTKSRLKKFYRQLEQDADQAANEWLLAQHMDPAQIHHYYLRIEPQVRDQKADHEKLSNRIQRRGLPAEIIDPWWQNTESSSTKAP